MLTVPHDEGGFYFQSNGFSRDVFPKDAHIRKQADFPFTPGKQTFSAMVFPTSHRRSA